VLTPESFMVLLALVSAVFAAQSLAFGIAAVVVPGWRSELGLKWVFSLAIYVTAFSILILGALVSSIGGAPLVTWVGLTIMVLSAFTVTARWLRVRYEKKQSVQRNSATCQTVEC
jgi:uncharacterized membrane protein